MESIVIRYRLFSSRCRRAYRELRTSDKEAARQLVEAFHKYDHRTADRNVITVQRSNLTSNDVVEAIRKHNRRDETD